MSLIILYPLFFGLLLCRDKNRANNKLYSIIILIFFLSGCAAYYLVVSKQYIGYDISFIAVVYHITCLFLLLSPLKKYDSYKSVPLAQSNSTILYPFTIIIVIVMAAYIIDGWGDIDFYTLLNDSQELRANLDEEYYDKGSLISYIAYFGRLLSVTPLALMFYFIIHEPHKRTLIIILLLCSLCSAVMSLREGGREYVMKYLFVFCSVYYLCRNQITQRWERSINIFFVCIAICFIGLFAIISFLRFDTGLDDNNVIRSLVSYFGQGDINFCDRFVNYPYGVYTSKGHSNFPLFAGRTNTASMLQPVNHAVVSNAFGTGIGTWLSDCGCYITFLVVLVYNYIFKKIGSMNRFSVYQLTFIALVYEFTFSLLFFFHNPWIFSKLMAMLLLIFCELIDRKTLLE